MLSGTVVLTQAKAGRMIVGEHARRVAAAARIGHLDRIRLDDQVADRQDQPVLADDRARSLALAAERRVAAGVGDGDGLHAHQRAIQTLRVNARCSAASSPCFFIAASVAAAACGAAWLIAAVTPDNASSTASVRAECFRNVGRITNLRLGAADRCGRSCTRSKHRPCHDVRVHYSANAFRAGEARSVARLRTRADREGVGSPSRAPLPPGCLPRASAACRRRDWRRR